MEPVRQIIYYKDYFFDFFNDQSEKVKEKIDYVLDEGKIVVLFNGFQKKSQKTPQAEIDKALKIKAEYFEEKLKTGKR